jgi:hypothetical protein
MRVGLAAFVLAFAFGGADQYLGSLSAHPWATEASLLSAPWLALAFLAGWTQREPKHGALLGFACTASALAGYGLMTLSPVENAHLSLASVGAFVRSERPVIVGGMLTGPVFGWLGSRWRNDRARLGALAVGAAVSLEPLARRAASEAITLRSVWAAEIAVGLLMMIYVVAATLASQRRARRGAT